MINKSLVVSNSGQKNLGLLILLPLMLY